METEKSQIQTEKYNQCFYMTIYRVSTIFEMCFLQHKQYHNKQKWHMTLQRIHFVNLMNYCRPTVNIEYEQI